MSIAMPPISTIKKSIFFVLVFFAFLIFLVTIYWAGLYSGFFFDDEANVLLPEGVRMVQFTHGTISDAIFSGHAGILGRSVAQLSFALNYYISGFDPFVFKATNLAIHAVNSGLVLVLGFRLLGASSPQASRRSIQVAAALLAIIWTFHPIQLTSVLLVVQRMTSLSALFLLSALLLHMRGREVEGRSRVFYLLLAWMLFWPLSVFSKETGLLFPLFVLAWELVVRRSIHARGDQFTRMFSSVILVLALLALGYGLSASGHWLWAGYEMRNFSLLERVLTEGRVLWFYLGLIGMPTLDRLGLYHDDLTISKSLLFPWVTLPALLGVIALAWLSWRERIRYPIVSFGIAWFLIGHGMESTVLPLEIAHEHRNYVPSFGILLAGIAALVPWLDQPGWKKTFTRGLAASLAVYFSFITTLRAHQFGDDVRRTQIEAQHHEGSARAQYEAGLVLSRIASTAPKNAPVQGLARRHFELSLALDPAFKLGAVGLIYLDCLQGRAIEHQWVSELTSRLRDTPFAPGDIALFYSLKEMSVAGTICLAREDVDALFSVAFDNKRIAPGERAKLYSWYADYLWLVAHDMASARIALSASLVLVPSSTSNRLKWAQLLFLSGDHVAARELLEKLRGQSLSVTERWTLNSLLSAPEDLRR